MLKANRYVKSHSTEKRKLSKVKVSKKAEIDLVWKNKDKKIQFLRLRVFRIALIFAVLKIVDKKVTIFLT